jgi:protein disulfide-isomerase A1
MRPKFEPFRVDSQKQYFNNAPILLFFTPVAEDALAEANNVIRKLAERYSHDLKFLTLDAVAGNRFMTSLGFGRYADPAAVILIYDRTGKMTRYLHPEDDPFTVEDLSSFIEDYLDKKLKPTLKSATLPQPNNGPVYEVTANTFQAEILDSDDNYILLYYEEWDRLYQEFLVEYSELAEAYKNSSVTDLKFAKFDVSKNDLVAGPDPKKTPFLYLFAAKLKNKPIAYLGQLHKKPVANFIYEELDLQVKDL